MFKRYAVVVALCVWTGSACGGRAVQQDATDGTMQESVSSLHEESVKPIDNTPSISSSDDPDSWIERPDASTPQGEKEYSILEMNDVVNTLRPHVYRCYQQQLQRDQSARGRLELQIRVNTEGRVDETKLLRSDLDEIMGTCVLEHAKTLAFEPLPARGSITLQKVFILAYQ